MTSIVEHSNIAVRAALTCLEKAFTAGSAESPRVAAEWSLSAVLGCPRLELWVRLDTPLSDSSRAQLADFETRARCGEPLQYILGETEFMGLRIACDARALIPRPETEQLVATIMDDLRQSVRTQSVIVDVGTGTGCIALALAHALPHADVRAIDADSTALVLARENAERLGLADRVRFEHGDLLAGAGRASVDVIVANLPYLSTPDWQQLPQGVREYEPRAALDGGSDGLDFIACLVRQGRDVLRPGGRIYLEIGADQGAAARSLLDAAGYVGVTVCPDWAGRDRIVRGAQP